MSAFHWDPSDRFVEGLLREYEHWTLGVQFLQVTLGSFVILANRQGIERFSALTPPELTELVVVMGDMERALEASEPFRPDRFNYEQLGNHLHHLHLHGIPRYATPRSFAGREWVDATWGWPPKWPNENLDVEVVRQIRDALLPHLPAR